MTKCKMARPAYFELLKRFSMQCTINGVNYDKLQMGAGSKVKKLEIFFFGFPHIVGMRHFPNLRSLCVVNQKIGKLSGLESCWQLEELWVCEGNIKVCFHGNKLHSLFFFLSVQTKISLNL